MFFLIPPLTYSRRHHYPLIVEKDIVLHRSFSFTSFFLINLLILGLQRVKRDGLQLLAAETSTVQSGDTDADDEYFFAEYNDESEQGMILHHAKYWRWRCEILENDAFMTGVSSDNR